MKITIEKMEDGEYQIVHDDKRRPGVFCLTVPSYEEVLKTAAGFLLDHDSIRDRIDLELNFKRQWLCDQVRIARSNTWEQIALHVQDLTEKNINARLALGGHVVNEEEEV